MLMSIASDVVPTLGSNSINTPVLSLLLALIGAVSAVWVETVKARRRAQDASDVAQETLKNTQPTSDGFGKQVLDRLENIERRQMRIEEGLQEHLLQHNRRRSG